jgi:Asp-tRNA(Asn)/Glu-tRNA(Gln) amidotransferase A subunit family amidase
MLSEAGAVLIAKLSTGEMAAGANWFGGQTKNPWNYGSASGSSAGPGSATGAGCVGFAIGTETQGSILGPSGTNGLAGLRPTFGRVSRHGAMTLGWTYDRLGPMCRYAEDCAMVMSVIAKPDGRDMSVSDIPFNWNPARYDLKKIRIGVVGMNGSNVNPNAQKLMDVLKTLGATVTPLTIPPDNLPAVSEGFNYEQGAFFDEFVRAGGVPKMTSPQRGEGFKSARLMNVVDFLQSQRIRMMMMTHLAKATAGVDVYFSAAPQGQRGGGGRGAAPAAAAPAGERGAAGGGPGGPGGPNGPNPLGNTNSAGYPGLNVVVSFSEPSETAPVGSPQGIVLYGPPFKETEIIFVAKSVQDVLQLHTKKPVLKA